jgi:DNA primase|tara:strand:+ start:13491 stop:14375 length:885 start_codon:yes stop_codon:yes gene_type:complete
MSLNQIINGDIDWTQILLATNLDIPIDRDEFSIPCPLHLDTHASCSINTKKGVWICFAGCGQGSLFTFIQQLLDYDAPTVRKFLDQFHVSLTVTAPTKTLEFNSETDLPPSFIADDYPNWIYDRGFTEEFLKQWGCGTNIYEDLIIPIRDNKSTLVGFVSRRQNTVPKYMYSTGLKKSQLLFGADKVEPSEFVCITEGSLDTMWLQQNGYQSVALLGIHLSVTQAKLLRELPTKEFVLCLDNDKAGQLGREKALWRLKKIAQTSYINIPDPHKDVQDIRDKEHLDKLIQNRYYW